MLMCSRCHKRMAVVFITKLENGEKKNEGVCITCAKELGLPLDNMLGDMMNKLGISSDELANMEDDMAKMMVIYSFRYVFENARRMSASSQYFIHFSSGWQSVAMTSMSATSHTLTKDLRSNFSESTANILLSAEPIIACLIRLSFSLESVTPRVMSSPLQEHIAVST